jgi:Fe2+ transport system protein FeoA
MVASRLSKVEHGVVGEVIKIQGPLEFHRRLLKVGLCCGRTVEIRRVSPPAAYIQVHTNAHNFWLSGEEASRIWLDTI